MSTAHKVRFYTDDFRRIFSKCRLKKRGELHEQIAERGAYFHDLRCGEAYRALGSTLHRQVVYHVGPVHYRIDPPRHTRKPTVEGRLQTERATLISGRARRRQAERKAQGLALIKAELANAAKGPTLQEIAEEANARGFTTTQGNRWSPATVQRALKRIDDAVQE